MSRGRGRMPRRVPGKMNSTEKAYAEYLDSLDEVVWWKYEPFRLQLAKSTTYQPDFLVMDWQGFLICIEVKGYWRDDARAKVKIAAEMFPVFRFRAATRVPKRDGGGWKHEDFESSWTN